MILFARLSPKPQPLVFYSRITGNGIHLLNFESIPLPLSEISIVVSRAFSEILKQFFPWSLSIASREFFKKVFYNPFEKVFVDFSDNVFRAVYFYNDFLLTIPSARNERWNSFLKIIRYFFIKS